MGGSDEDVPFFRVLNHFYDPFHNASLGTKAPDWALEDQGDLDGQNHSYKDARQAFYNGLTLSNRDQRERELGHTFYSLGHVIHLIQDMAQPQHTRGDLHPPIWPFKSFFEEYADVNVDSLKLSSAAIPTVAQARDLWVAQNGRGFSQFSNANFVSAGTNFTELRTGATAERFPSPALNLDDRSASPTACKDGTEAPGPMTFYANVFPDPVTAVEIRNPLMTTHSIFDQHLVSRGKRPLFALNCFNVDAALDILLPRTVAYSAALLKYFFRGDVATEVAGSGFHILNRTPGEAMSGSFELYYDATDGSRVQAAKWSLSLDPGGRSDALKVPAPLPGKLPIERDRYLLVFRGRLGEEADAVAGRWVRLSPKPVILVYFFHEGQWWQDPVREPYLHYDRYVVYSPETIALMEYYQGLPGVFKRLETIFIRLYSGFVPPDPNQLLTLTQIPFDVIERLESSPDPVQTNRGWIMNYLQPGGGTSFVDYEGSWRVTVYWDPDLAQYYPHLLGYDADGQVDLSPRVVKACPWRERTGPAFFAPHELQHPQLNHCPDWLVFGD